MIKFFTKRLNNKKGFTLIELIVVIAILGILAAIVVPRIGKFRTKAANSAHNANVRTLLGAATMCLAEKGLDSGIDWKGEGDKEDKDDAPGWGDYLNSWPTPPEGAEYNLINPTPEDTSEYTVKMDGDEIVVTPGLIPDNAT